MRLNIEDATSTFHRAEGDHFQPHDMQAVDIDQDGQVEYVASISAAGSVVFHGSLTNWKIEDVTYWSTRCHRFGYGNDRNAAFADWNADGYTDMARCDYDGAALHFGPLEPDSLDDLDVDVFFTEQDHPSGEEPDGHRALYAIGDLNLDGIDDLLITEHNSIEYVPDGVPDAWPTGGAAFLFYGPVTTSGEVTDADFALRPSESFSMDTREGSLFLGDSARNVGDLNGDGFDEIAVMGWAMLDEELGITEVYQDGVYIVEGPPEGELLTEDTMARYLGVLGDVPDVTAPGDVDGDGYPELIMKT